MGSFVGRGNYIQLIKVLYCKLPTISKQLPTFPHRYDLTSIYLVSFIYVFICINKSYFLPNSSLNI